jgi:hypothetical protein
MRSPDGFFPPAGGARGLRRKDPIDLRPHHPAPPLKRHRIRPIHNIGVEFGHSQKSHARRLAKPKLDMNLPLGEGFSKAQVFHGRQNSHEFTSTGAGDELLDDVPEVSPTRFEARTGRRTKSLL